MELLLVRDVFTTEFTLGVLTVNGLDFGYTCEDRDRSLDQSMPLDKIAATKVKGRTAIPYGRYRVKRTYSPKYKRHMALVCDVPGFQGIRIHSGNSSEDTEGCLLPGLARTATGVAKSKPAADWLDKEIEKVEKAGDEVWVTIRRT